MLQRTVISAALALFSGLSLAEPVNINTADVQTLDSALEDVGPSKAQAIIQYREAFGPFQAVDDLVKVKGIGEKTVERNRANMTVGGES